MFFSPFVALADSAAAHRQKAAQFRALADEQEAAAKNLIAHNDSVDARQNEQEAQLLRNAAAAEDNVANQMEAASAGASGSGYGGYNAPSGGNDKVAAIGQLVGQLGNMAALMQQIQDRKNADAQQEQSDRDQAAADAHAKELQQQADDAEKKVEDQQKLTSLRQQYGGLYQSTDPKSGDAPAVGSTLSSWISTAPAATASPAATGDTSAMVSDVIGDSSPSSPGTASNAQTSALVDSVLADGPAPSQPASDTPSGASGTPSVQADNSKSPSMVDDVLSGPGGPAPANTATDGQSQGNVPTGAANAPDANAAETAALAKQGINPATIHPSPEENDGTGAPLFLGQNLNKGPYAGTNLSGPLPDVVADCNKAKPFPKDTPAASLPSVPPADQTPAEIEALAKQGIHPANFHSPPEEDVGTGAPLFLGENLNKGPSAGMNLGGPNPDLTKELNLQPAPAVDQKKIEIKTPDTPVSGVHG
jgi:hypothetical protein